MTTTIKITELTNIGANLASSTVIPVVNMAGTPTTEKTVLGNIANVILAGAGGNYVSAAKATTATTANTVLTNAQPNITSIGNLTGLTVSNATGIVNFSNTANVTLGNVSNLHIAGGTAGQLLSTNGNGTLSWASDTTTYGNSNVVTLLSAFGSNTITTTGNISGGNLVTGGQVVASGNVSSGTGLTTGGFLSVDGTADLHNTTVTGYANVTGTANTVGGGATVGVRSILAIDSTFGSNSSADPASAQAVRGRVTGANLTKTRNYVTGVTGQYLVTGTNASEFIKAGVLGVVGDQTTTADGAVVAYLDGDGGLTTANAAYAVSMKNSTPNSGFNYGLDLQFINLNVAGTTTTFKQADIRFNNGVTLVANTAGNISINANVTVGNIIATNIGNISNINLTGNASNVLYGNGVFAAVAGGANTGNVTFSDQVVMGTGGNDGTGGLYLAPGNASIANSAVQYLRVRGGDVVTHIHLDTGNNAYYDQYFGADSRFVKLEANGNVVINADDYAGNGATWTLDTTGNLTLPGNLVIAGNANVFGTNASLLQTTDNRPLIALSSGANGAVSSLWVEDVANVGTSNIAAVYANPTVGSGIVRIAVGQNGGGGPNLWDFDTTGNLTLPDTTSVIANVSITLEANDTGNITGLNLIGDSNANLYAHGNVKIVSDSSNTTATWTFGADGNLTIPGTSGGFIKTISNASIGIAAMDNGTNNPAQLLSINVGNGNATSIISAYATNATIQTNASGNINTWQFDNAGNLTLPTNGHIIVSGGLVSSGASPAPTINGFSITNSVGISGNGNIAGNNISATGNISANNFTGNGGTLSNVATKVEGSWTLASGTNTVSINVPLNGTYTIWINGNIPNGIVTYTATGVVTNTNVPVLGEQYAWYYAVGNALVFTTIPDQFVGTVGSISTVNTYAGNTANVFTFGITNNSGNTAVVNYGYTKL